LRSCGACLFAHVTRRRRTFLIPYSLKTPMTPLMYIKCSAPSLGMLDLCDCSAARVHPSRQQRRHRPVRRHAIGKNRLEIECSSDRLGGMPSVCGDHDDPRYTRLAQHLGGTRCFALQLIAQQNAPICGRQRTRKHSSRSPRCAPRDADRPMLRLACAPRPVRELAVGLLLAGRGQNGSVGEDLLELL